MLTVVSCAFMGMVVIGAWFSKSHHDDQDSEVWAVVNAHKQEVDKIEWMSSGPGFHRTNASCDHIFNPGPRVVFGKIQAARNAKYLPNNHTARG